MKKILSFLVVVVVLLSSALTLGGCSSSKEVTIDTVVNSYEQASQLFLLELTSSLTDYYEDTPYTPKDVKMTDITQSMVRYTIEGTYYLYIGSDRVGVPHNFSGYVDRTTGRVHIEKR